jgi:hypothetical protein
MRPLNNLHVEAFAQAVLEDDSTINLCIYYILS